MVKFQNAFLKFSWLVLLTLVIITSCGTKPTGFVHTETISVNEQVRENQELDFMISPYREELEAEMSKVISYAPKSIERKKPEGELGNLVTDLTLDYLKKHKLVSEKFPQVCIMNHFGLRSPIYQGNVTVESIFKLMPFDNSIVVLKVGLSTIEKMVNYIRTSGGEPISGITITARDFELWQNNLPVDTIQLVSTNYLVGGGDQMTFFEDNYEKEDLGVLLRDILIEMIGEKDTLVGKIEGRIML